VDGHVVGRLVDEVNNHRVALPGLDGRAGEPPIHRRDDPRRQAQLAYRQVPDLAIIKHTSD